MRSTWWKVVAVAALAGAAACSESRQSITAPPRRDVPTVRAATATVSGAGYTSVNETVDGTGHCKNGNPDNNCNIYDGKQYVWLNGGPLTGEIGDGTYFFAVLQPSGQSNPNDGDADNLSSPNDAYTNRTFTVSGGTIAYTGTHDFNSNKIRLMPYDDTDNPGGVYILAICSVANGYPVDASQCKYDAFKIGQGGENIYTPPTVSKKVAASYKDVYSWTIDKSVAAPTTVDLTSASATATFDYTVTVTRSGPAAQDFVLGGVITLVNNNASAVVIDAITDELNSTGEACTLDPAVTFPLSIPHGETDVSYSCAVTGHTATENTVTITWSTQQIGEDWLMGGSNQWTEDVDWSVTAYHASVDVTDDWNGATATLGTVPPFDAGSSNTRTFTYSHTVPAPRYGCVTYDNTATYTATDDASVTGSDGPVEVTVCRVPLQTGALTMGFWQNKNGQGIITGGASTAGVCNAATWLRQYAPFQDLSATASCSAVASYVYNVIKAANARGAAMNAMLKAQMLATSLDVYFSDPALGGDKINAPAPIGGVSIDLTTVCKLGSGGCSAYEDVSAAFGGAASMTVAEMLGYAASQSNAGGSAWYGQVKATQELAKDAFDAINNQKAYAP